MAGRIEGRVRELLEQPNFAHVVTTGPNGPHAVVVWVDADADSVVLNSAEGRAWPRNLNQNRETTITVADKDNPYEYVAIVGHLREATHEHADEHIDALAKKYLNKDTYPFRAPGEQRVILRIEPDRVRHVAQ